MKHKIRKHNMLVTMLLLVAAMAMPKMAWAQVTLTYDSSSDGFTNETASNLFDGDTSTKWCYSAPSTSSSVWVVFKANEECRLKGYTITTANDNASNTGRNPKDWIIYGSNDKSEWTKLDSVSNDTKLQDQNFTPYEFSLGSVSTNGYEYYKWEITANKGADVFQVSEFSITVSNCTDDTHEVALTLKEKREATCTEVGYTQNFYQCSSCGRSYSNEAGTTEINLESVTIPATGHQFDGENGDCSVCGLSHMFSHAGTAADPLQISTADDLYWFAAWVNGTYTPEEGETAVTHLDACAVLMNDITVNTGVLDADGTLASDVSDFREWTLIGNNGNRYNGTFNGQGHMVSGLYFNNSAADYVGLFGYICGKISNVGVVDSYFKGSYYVGGVCGYCDNGSIKYCFNKGAISGIDNMGGLCGFAAGGNIENCYNAGTVSGSGQKVCGVCGNNVLTYITNCYFDSNKCNKDAVGNNSIAFVTKAEGKTTAQFASGEVCYLLNDGKTDGTQAWYQNLSAETGDKVPVLKSNSKNTVYPSFLYCDGSTMSEGSGYNNISALHIKEYVVFDDTERIYKKKCSNCNHYVYCATSDGTVTATKEGDTFKVESFTLQDATPYDNQAVFTVNDFTYERTFEDTGWTTWYVPFDLKLTEELCNSYSFSRINNVHRYDDDEDGTPDRTEVEAFSQLPGVTLKANYPYLVKAKETSDCDMNLLLNSVHPAQAEENTCFCQSIDYKYSFTGTYSGKTGVGSGNEDPYSLQSDGEWTHQAEISPMRHYLTISSRTAEPQSSFARICLVVIGDETPTGVVIPYSEEKRQAETYDLSGRLTDSNQRGIVIKNGKKIINNKD